MACDDKKIDYKKDILKPVNDQTDLDTSKRKQTESNSNNILNKVKNYIDNKLHHVGTQAFDEYVSIEPERQFFVNQHYNDVVNVIDRYVKLFCKKEKLTLVKVELDAYEQDVTLDERNNVIWIKLTLKDQSVGTTVTLKNVKQPSTEEQKANLLATKLINETHNFTYNYFNESNTVNDVASKIKQIYQKDLVVNYFNNIIFDEDNGKILPSANLKWGENIIPWIVQYNRKPTKINLKINLISQEQFSEYEINRVIDEILLNSETTNSIFCITANIEQPVDKVLLGYGYYDILINRINNFLDCKSDVEVKRYSLQEIDQRIVKTFPFNVTFVVFLNDYNKEVEITITR